MDGDRFDDLTRDIGARAISRRRAIRLIASAVIGGALTRRSSRDAVAACPPDQVHRRGLGCVCKATGRPPRPEGCPCANRETRCDGICTDLARDPDHCGSCGATCQSGPNVAAAGCGRGGCRIVTCAAGWADCDGDYGSGCETPLGTKTDCGFCGDACLATDERCGGQTPGVCGCADNGQACGTAVCGTATNNCSVEVTCGSLGGACPAGHECQDGQCVCMDATCATVIVITNDGPLGVDDILLHFDLPPIDAGTSSELTVGTFASPTVLIPRPAPPMPVGSSFCTPPILALKSGATLDFANIGFVTFGLGGALFGAAPAITVDQTVLTSNTNVAENDPPADGPTDPPVE